jgi:hypothetical protein
MNTSTQPPEGAGRSKARSKAAGELTLGLMSGEKQKRFVALFFCGSWLASDGGLTADQSPSDVHRSIVGASLLAMTA